MASAAGEEQLELQGSVVFDRHHDRAGRHLDLVVREDEVEGAGDDGGGVVDQLGLEGHLHAPPHAADGEVTGGRDGGVAALGDPVTQVDRLGEDEGGRRVLVRLQRPVRRGGLRSHRDRHGGPRARR